MNISSSYPVPAPGEIIESTQLQEARKHYIGKDVKFLIYFNIYDKNSNIDMLDEKVKTKEYQRLVSLGYSLCETNAWTYKGKGEKSYYKAVLLLLSEDEIADFKINEDYGYFFGFLYNGDHSPLDFKKCTKLNLVKGEEI